MAKALIFAGGTGVRMNSKSRPKQFLELHGKPIIIYTIDHFEKHCEIDDIVVVCIKSWIPELRRELCRYGIEKVSTIVEGGASAFESIYNGLCALRERCKPEDIVLIHDGVRPLISESLISSNIACAKENGNAITIDYARESIVASENFQTISQVMPREEMRIAKAPQTFRFIDIYSEYENAYMHGEQYIDSCQLMQKRGYTLSTVYSTEYNIKITTPTDFYIFRALTDALENSQIFGLEP